MTISSPGKGCEQRERTYWEAVANTRWGRYTTSVEASALAVACQAVGAPGTVLEVGCEGGRWSAQLSESGWSPICVDIDSQALATCQRRLPNAKCILTSPQDCGLPCSSGAVHLVLCIEVFPVVESEWFPLEALRVLAPGGVLVCVALNRASLRSWASRALGRDKLALSGQFYGKTYRTVRRRFAEAGFSFLLERGFCWAPFSRASDSRLIPACLALERILQLQRLVSWSPWVVFVARKAILAGSKSGASAGSEC